MHWIPVDASPCGIGSLYFNKKFQQYKQIIQDDNLIHSIIYSIPTDSFLEQSTFSSKHIGIIKFIEEINALYHPEICYFLFKEIMSLGRFEWKEKTHAKTN